MRIATIDGFVAVSESYQEPGEIPLRAYRFTGAKALKRQAREVGELIGLVKAHGEELSDQLETFWECLLEGGIAKACELEADVSQSIIDAALEARRTAYAHLEPCVLCPSEEELADERDDPEFAALFPYEYRINVEGHGADILGHPYGHDIWQY